MTVESASQPTGPGAAGRWLWRTAAAWCGWSTPMLGDPRWCCCGASGATEAARTPARWPHSSDRCLTWSNHGAGEDPRHAVGHRPDPLRACIGAGPGPSARGAAAHGLVGDQASPRRRGRRRDPLVGLTIRGVDEHVRHHVSTKVQRAIPPVVALGTRCVDEVRRRLQDTRWLPGPQGRAAVRGSDHPAGRREELTNQPPWTERAFAARAEHEVVDLAGQCATEAAHRVQAGRQGRGPQDRRAHCGLVASSRSLRSPASA